MKNTSQFQNNRLKWKIDKYDFLKFSLNVRVKNFEMFLNVVAKANAPQVNVRFCWD